jgi:quercetin dioxygenase-like cupin family protein
VEAQTQTKQGTEAVIIHPETADRIQAGPMSMLVIEDGSHTSLTHAVIEFTFNGQFSPPKHIHHQHEEVIYVLDGEMELLVNDDTVRLGPGAAFVTPIGLPHTFSNGGTGPLRFLLTISPAKHLGYFLDMAKVMQGPPDPEAVKGVMQRYGLEPIRPA